LTRVNLGNVLDEGLRIGRRGRRMNSKVKVIQKGKTGDIIETKLGFYKLNLDVSSAGPSWPLL
jgi:hypothetical protein